MAYNYHLLVLFILRSIAHAEQAKQAGPISLIAIGDWGGDSDTQPTTAAQIAASAGMSRVAQSISAKGILLLGDNFYTEGVETETSSRFNATFEQVYPSTSFQNLPFYVIAGNHDHRGNVQAQIQYHDESLRWHFPKLYYTLKFNFTSSTGILRTIDLVMLDTVSLVGGCDGEDVPGCYFVLSTEEAIEAENQWDWLNQEMNSSTADFLWVAGHYPVYSAGSDGTTPQLVSRLLPMLKSYGAHYISGHDHMHEHILIDSVHMFVTGPGKECCYDDIHLDTIPKNGLQFMISGINGSGTSVGKKPTSPVLSGFSSLEFDDAVRVKMYKEDGEILWAPPAIAARALSYNK